MKDMNMMAKARDESCRQGVRRRDEDHDEQHACEADGQAGPRFRSQDSGIIKGRSIWTGSSSNTEPTSNCPSWPQTSSPPQEKEIAQMKAWL